jgi:HAD superfamily hydrolase (TIGR01509 family)
VTPNRPAGASDRPRALLLDMDGTLVQSEHLWGQAESAVMAELMVPWTDLDRSHVIGGPLERVVAYMIGKSEGEHDHDDVARRLLSHVEERFRSENLQWSDGMVQLLNECDAREIPVALVTASTRRLTAIVVDELDRQLRRTVFSAVVTADDVSRSKPAPDPYVLAAHRLAQAPEDCLAIEDSPTGLLSARRAGCRVLDIERMGSPQSNDAVFLDELWRVADDADDSTGFANDEGNPGRPR